MSLTTELEELLKEKAQLQRILQSTEEEEKYLGKRLRIVEEKITIQVLKEKIKAKREVVEQIKSKIWDLEKRLKEPEASSTPQTPTPQVARKEEPQKKEPMEVTVSAAPAGNQQLGRSQGQQEKKEGRFFR